MSLDQSSLDTLTISLGQWSSAGRKSENQDCHGAVIPTGPNLALKGITLVIADGISSSAYGREAADISIKGLLTDYYSTSDAWTVKNSASCVISATNAWLHGKSRAAHVEDIDQGWVSTLSALILKSHRAHIFHVGDSRVWRLTGRAFEQLTTDHNISGGALSRAMGAAAQVKIDYIDLPLTVGDVFVMTTDGMHEVMTGARIADALDDTPDLDAAAKSLVQAAYEAGSKDNLTVQIIRIEALPAVDEASLMQDVETLPCPDLPKAGAVIDGYTIQRAIHSNARSHIYLALAPDGTKVAFKIPSVDLRDDADYRRRFLMEEWIARRVDNPHVLQAVPAPLKRTKFYVLSEFIEGQTLRQWMHDNPKASLQQVRDIIGQLITGTRALHRREMLHQDLRPENVMIDRSGTVRIIDFGSTLVAGVVETAARPADQETLGTLQYAAPEYFAGEPASPASDLYSIGVIAYEMLTGNLPYGTQVARVRARKDLRGLSYRSACDEDNAIPLWVDDALKTAMHPNVANRQPSMSEFLADLKRPSARWSRSKTRPLIERHPLAFWKALSAGLAAVIVIILAL